MGRGLRVKRLMTFSFSVKHVLKNKKLTLHIDSAYFYQDNKTHINTLSVVIQSSIQLQQKETLTNTNTFNRAVIKY